MSGFFAAPPLPTPTGLRRLFRADLGTYAPADYKTVPAVIEGVTWTGGGSLTTYGPDGDGLLFEVPGGSGWYPIQCSLASYAALAGVTIGPTDRVVILTTQEIVSGFTGNGNEFGITYSNAGFNDFVAARNLYDGGLKQRIITVNSGGAAVTVNTGVTAFKQGTMVDARGYSAWAAFGGLDIDPDTYDTRYGPLILATRTAANTSDPWNPATAIVQLGIGPGGGAGFSFRLLTFEIWHGPGATPS